MAAKHPARRPAPTRDTAAREKAAREIDGEPIEAGRVSKPSGTLSIVATPIGNLGDLTVRARDLLAAADCIACEDTRVTAKLLTAFDLRTTLLAYHDHNAQRVRPQIIQRLNRGENVALVSDAGTPLISDPGLKLVRAALAAGLTVTAAPGASACLTALVLSGLPSDRFFFGGFLPNKTKARRAALAELKDLRASLIFYEGPSRLAACLADMAAVFGPRQAAVARELTKLYEELRRDDLTALAAHYAEAGAPKGEVVVVVGPPDDRPAAADQTTLDAVLRETLAKASVKDAAASVALAYDLPRRALYQRALELLEDPAPDESGT